MEVSKGIFNFRDVREIHDSTGEINELCDSANGNKCMYGKYAFMYAIIGGHPEYLESYSMVNDWGDVYELGVESWAWHGHTVTFSAKALPSVIYRVSDIDADQTVLAPVIERIVTSKTTVGLLITNPNNFEVDLFDSDDTFVTTLAKQGSYTIQDLTTVTATYYYFKGYYKAQQYLYKFSKDLTTWYTEASFTWTISGATRIGISTKLTITELSKDITSVSTSVPTGPFIAYYYPGYGNCTITDYNNTFTVNFESSTVYAITAGTKYIMQLAVPSTTGFISKATVTTITGSTTTDLTRSNLFQVTSPSTSRTIDSQYKYCTYKYTFTSAATETTGLLFAPEVFLRSNIKYLHINNATFFHGPLSTHSPQCTMKYTASGNSGSITAYSSVYYYFTEGIILTGGYHTSFGAKPSGVYTQYAFGYSDGSTISTTWAYADANHLSTVAYLTGANNNPNVKYRLLGTKDLEALYAYIGWENYTFTATTELTPTISSTTPYIMTVKSPKNTTECWCDNKYQFTLNQTAYTYMVFTSSNMVKAAVYPEAHADLFAFHDTAAQFYDSTPASFASTLANTTIQTLSVYSATAARHIAKKYCQLADITWEMRDIVAVRYTSNQGTYSVLWYGEEDDSDGDETVYSFYGSYYNGASWVKLSQSNYVTVYYLVSTATATGVYYQVHQTPNAYISGMNNFIQSFSISTTAAPHSLCTSYISSTATSHYINKYLSGSTMSKSSGPYKHFIATNNSSDHSILYQSTMGTKQYVVKNFVSAIYWTQSDSVTYYYAAYYNNYSTSGGQACYWNGSTFVQLATVNGAGATVGIANLWIIAY